MDKELIVLSSRLLDRANHLRSMALQARSRGIAMELERLAQHYETDAADLELRGMGIDRGDRVPTMSIFRVS